MGRVVVYTNDVLNKVNWRYRLSKLASAFFWRGEIWGQWEH